MEEFRVPQKQIQVSVCLQNGDEVTGRMFVPQVGVDAHPEPLVDRLNKDERFLPFARDEVFEMVNKSRILCVRLEGKKPRVEEYDGTLERRVSIEMEHGLVVEGDLRYWMPHERSRLLDYLNDSPRFIEVADGTHLTLVNTDHVLRILALSADPA